MSVVCRGELPIADHFAGSECLRLSINVKSRSAIATPSPDRIGSHSKLPSGAPIAVKQPPEIAPIAPPCPWR